jgi:hypothetical protein
MLIRRLSSGYQKLKTFWKGHFELRIISELPDDVPTQKCPAFFETLSLWVRNWTELKFRWKREWAKKNFPCSKMGVQDPISTPASSYKYHSGLNPIRMAVIIFCICRISVWLANIKDMDEITGFIGVFTYVIF